MVERRVKIQKHNDRVSQVRNHINSLVRLPHGWKLHVEFRHQGGYGAFVRRPSSKRGGGNATLYLRVSPDWISQIYDAGAAMHHDFLVLHREPIPGSLECDALWHCFGVFMDNLGYGNNLKIRFMAELAGVRVLRERAEDAVADVNLLFLDALGVRDPDQMRVHP